MNETWPFDVPDADAEKLIGPEAEPLNPRQKAFVEEYVIDLNCTQAAIRAGYSPSNAGPTGANLRVKPNIAAAIEKALAARSARVGITQDTVLNEMAMLARSSVDHYVIDDYGNVKPAEGAPEGVMKAIQSIDRSVTINKDGSKTYNVKIKLWDKPRPLQLMGRHVGLFPDRVEVTGKNGAPIETVTEIRRVIVDPKEPPKP